MTTAQYSLKWDCDSSNFANPSRSFPMFIRAVEMRILPCFLGWLFCQLMFSTSCAQTKTAVDEVREKQASFAISATSTRLNFVYSHIRGKSTELELVDQQVQQIKDIQLRHFGLIGELKQTENRTDADWNSILRRIKDLERELVTEVLLPHQAALIQKEFLEKTIRLNGGNYSVAIMKIFGDDLQLSDLQKKQFEKLNSKLKRRLKEEEKKYKQAIEEISNVGKTDLRSILSNEQLQLIESSLGK